MTCLAAVDIGTTLIKAGLFDATGRMCGFAAQPFALASPREGWFELDPEDCWQAICRATRQAVKSAQVSGIASADVAAIGLSSQGETVVPLDSKGKPLHRFVVWIDRRASAEAEEIETHFGADRLYAETGVSQLVPGHTASAILWWRKNRPDIFARTSLFALTKDYAILRMTGQAFIDHQLAGSTACYSVPREGWWPKVMDFVGLDAGRLSTLCRPETATGGLTASAAKALGLPEGCPVVAGTWDQIAGAIGAGNVRTGIVSEMTGSCLALFAACRSFLTDPKRRMLAGRHAVGGGYLLPYTEFAGKALQRVRNSCYGETAPYEQLTAEASRVPVGCEGLVMDLSRTGSDSDLSALFTGGPPRSRAHMARAAMEAVAFALKDHVDALVELGLPVGTIISLGGGAQSDLWLQMKADLLGLPVHRPVCTESALLGAAILAGKGCGLFEDVQRCASQMARTERIFVPNEALHEPYRVAYERRNLLTRPS